MALISCPGCGNPFEMIRNHESKLIFARDYYIHCLYQCSKYQDLKIDVQCPRCNTWFLNKRDHDGHHCLDDQDGDEDEDCDIIYESDDSIVMLDNYCSKISESRFRKVADGPKAKKPKITKCINVCDSFTSKTVNQKTKSGKRKYYNQEEEAQVTASPSTNEFQESESPKTDRVINVRDIAIRLKSTHFELIKHLLPKTESKSETKTETKSETKSKTKTEPKTEPKSEPKTETKSETKTETKSEPKSEAKSETKTESVLKSLLETKPKFKPRRSIRETNSLLKSKPLPESESVTEQDVTTNLETQVIPTSSDSAPEPVPNSVHEQVSKSGQSQESVSISEELVTASTLGSQSSVISVDVGEHKCSFCGIHFPDSINLQFHVDAVHEPIKCHKCDFTPKFNDNTSSHMAQLQQHKHFEADLFEEHEINKLPFTSINWRHHFENNTCLICNNTIISPDKTVHIARHVGMRYCCSNCGLSFGALCALESHAHKLHVNYNVMKVRATKPIWIIPKDVLKVSKQGLKDQVAEDQEELRDQGIKCDTCPIKFLDSVDLQFHVAAVHEPIKCHKCDFTPTFNDKTSSHIGHHEHFDADSFEHHEIKDFEFYEKNWKQYLKDDVCLICKIVTKHVTKLHVIRHFGWRFTCPVCVSSFGSFGALKNHVKVCHVHVDLEEVKCTKPIWVIPKDVLKVSSQEKVKNQVAQDRET